MHARVLGRECSGDDDETATQRCPHGIGGAAALGAAAAPRRAGFVLRRSHPTHPGRDFHARCVPQAGTRGPRFDLPGELYKKKLEAQQAAARPDVENQKGARSAGGSALIPALIDSALTSAQQRRRSADLVPRAPPPPQSRNPCTLACPHAASERDTLAPVRPALSSAARERARGPQHASHVNSARQRTRDMFADRRPEDPEWCCVCALSLSLSQRGRPRRVRARPRRTARRSPRRRRCTAAPAAPAPAPPRTPRSSSSSTSSSTTAAATAKPPTGTTATVRACSVTSSCGSIVCARRSGGARRAVCAAACRCVWRRRAGRHQEEAEQALLAPLAPRRPRRAHGRVRGDAGAGAYGLGGGAGVCDRRVSLP